MDVNSLGSMRYDEHRLTGSFDRLTNSVNHAQNEVNNHQNFDQLLEKAVSTQNPSGSQNPAIDKTDKLYELCLELETFLVKNLVTSMRSTIQKSGLVDSGFAGKIYEDMLYDEYAKDLTKNANFGLAEQAYLQLTRQGAYQ